MLKVDKAFLIKVIKLWETVIIVEKACECMLKVDKVREGALKVERVCLKLRKYDIVS